MLHLFMSRGFRASNKIFDLLDTTTNLYTWISLLSILLVNS
jgi:hypothetical protein